MARAATWGTVTAAGALALAAACASKSASPPACDLDPGLDAAGCATVKTMALESTLPPARGNAKGDDKDAAYLGFIVFYDARFSSTLEVRCATCHLPERHFDDAVPTSTGLTLVTRNSPTALNAARMTTYFWDGRADTLWSQPLFAFENPKEMGFTRLEIAHRIAQSYTPSYTAAFGPLPPLSDTARFPAKGKPGDPAWEAMAPADQDAVNRLVANVGKGIEAYLRKLATGVAPFDRFVAGDATALNDAQRRGLRVALRARCFDCHSGPMMSDMAFHNLGVPAAAGADPDQGRAAAYAILQANPFNAAGPYYEGDPPPAAPAPAPADLGAFRTPTLRNVTLSAPYMHNGTFATLEDTIAFHAAGGGRGGSGFVGDVDPKLVPQTLSADDTSDLVVFLGALEGAYPIPPWNNWPQK